MLVLREFTNSEKKIKNIDFYGMRNDSYFQEREREDSFTNYKLTTDKFIYIFFFN